MKNNGVEIGWLFFSCLASSMISAQAMGNEDIIRKMGFSYQNVIDGLSLECAGIHNYLVSIRKYNPHGT